VGFLTEDLLTSIKSRSLAPISQSTFQDTDLLTIANEELRLKLVSKIMTKREDFFLQRYQFTTVSGLASYALPPKAIGNAIKCVFLINADKSRRDLLRVDVDRTAGFQVTNAEPSNFYFMGDSITLVPTPTNVVTIEVVYFARPSELVTTSLCAKITAISSLAGSTTLTVNTDLSTTVLTGAKVDIISATPPFLSLAEKSTVTSISSTQVVVSTASVSDSTGAVLPQVGDYIAPTGFSNIPQIPIEFHPVLAQMVAVRLLYSLGDLNKWNAGKAQLKEDLSDATDLIQNRAESSPEHITNRTGLVKIFSRRNGR
jgi:hypothetical protein